MHQLKLLKRQQVIEILSILSLLATGVCLYMEGVTLASLIILSLEIPCIVLLFIENRQKTNIIENNENLKSESEVLVTENSCLSNLKENFDNVIAILDEQNNDIDELEVSSNDETLAA